jgi:four helix bundle protein
MKTFKEIVAWQKGYELSLNIYKITSVFPKSEEFGLKSQLRRAAVSVISNIAEGFRRASLKDGIQFYNYSEASLEELKCQTMLAHDLGYLDDKAFGVMEHLQNETGKVLCGWIKSQKSLL